MWMGCAGSLNLIKKLRKSGKYREERKSIFAAEGTVAHAIREDILRFGFHPYDFIGDKVQADGFDFVVDADMIDNLIPGIDRIREIPGKLLVETRIDTTKWVGEDDDGHAQGGTLDAIVIDFDGEEVTISDLKYGMGVPVQAVGNKQLRIYLLGFLDWMADHYPEIDMTTWTFRIIIDMPRHAAGGGEWTIDYDELMEFGKEVKERAAATRDPDAPCTPGEDICRWCPAKDIVGACVAHEKWELDFLGLVFDDLDAEDDVDLPDVEGLTPKRCGYIIRNTPFIKKWLDNIHAVTLVAALEGNFDSGLKAVDGRAGIRKHKDEEKSIAFMKKRGIKDDDLYTKKVISPAQAEKVLRLGNKNFPANLVEQNDPKPSLVPVEDDRDAVIVRTEYDNLDDDDDI